LHEPGAPLHRKAALNVEGFAGHLYDGGLGASQVEQRRAA